MVGVIVVSHGSLAQSLLEAVSMILGDQAQVRAISLNIGEGLDDVRERIEEAVAEVDKGAGYVILADLQGGTPANAACLLSRFQGLRLVSGVNLPMLLAMFTARQTLSAEELVDLAVKSGRQGIQDLGAELRLRLRCSPGTTSPNSSEPT